MSGLKIDEWLPEYKVAARYSLVIHASSETTYAALTKAKLADLPIVKGLMRLRGYRASAVEEAAPNQQKQGSTFGAFVQLATIPQKEVLLGIAGRFWRPDGGIVHGLTPEEFRLFRRDGCAKAVWSFSLSPANDGTLLTTETRVQTFGRPAHLKFRLYWLAVGAFSGLMRKAMLREVKRIAEQAER
jgi:hypothetical protein